MWKAIVAGLLLGAAVSGLSLPLTGQREAFDANPAWHLTATFLAGALGTLPAPRFWSPSAKSASLPATGSSPCSADRTSSLHSGSKRSWRSDVMYLYETQ